MELEHKPWYFPRKNQKYLGLCSDWLVYQASCPLTGQFFSKVSLNGEAGVARWKVELEHKPWSTKNKCSDWLVDWAYCACISQFFSHKFSLCTLLEALEYWITECSTFQRSCIFSLGFADNFSDFSTPWHPWPPSCNDPFVKIANFPRRRDKVAPFLQLSTILSNMRELERHYFLSQCLFHNFFPPKLFSCERSDVRKFVV